MCVGHIKKRFFGCFYSPTNSNKFPSYHIAWNKKTFWRKWATSLARSPKSKSRLTHQLDTDSLNHGNSCRNSRCEFNEWFMNVELEMLAIFLFENLCLRLLSRHLLLDGKWPSTFAWKLDTFVSSYCFDKKRLSDSWASFQLSFNVILALVPQLQSGFLPVHRKRPNCSLLHRNT